MLRIFILSQTLLGVGMHAVLNATDTAECQLYSPLTRGPVERIAEEARSFQPDVSILDATSFEILPVLRAIGKDDVKYLKRLVVVSAKPPDDATLFFLQQWGILACTPASISHEGMVQVVREASEGKYTWIRFPEISHLTHPSALVGTCS